MNFKTRKHFKDKKSHYVDESEWTVFENTHEAIIDQEIFDNVQRIRANVRRYLAGYGEIHPLTGLHVLRRLRRQMEAKKAALRAEDMAKGVFYIAGSVPQQEPQKGMLPACNII